MHLSEKFPRENFNQHFSAGYKNCTIARARYLKVCTCAESFRVTASLSCFGSAASSPGIDRLILFSPFAEDDKIAAAAFCFAAWKRGMRFLKDSRLPCVHCIVEMDYQIRDIAQNRVQKKLTLFVDFISSLCFEPTFLWKPLAVQTR